MRTARAMRTGYVMVAAMMSQRPVVKAATALRVRMKACSMVEGMLAIACAVMATA